MATSFSVRTDVSEKMRKAYAIALDNMALGDLVKEFFTYLDYEEESDSGHVFSPITIGSCRILMTRPLNMCLEKMREVAAGDEAPDKYHRHHEIHEGNCVTCYNMGARDEETPEERAAWADKMVKHD